MRTSARIILTVVLAVFLVSCGRVSNIASSEVTVSSLHIYETPEIALVRVDDNTKRIRGGYYDGPAYVYYLFDKNGDVYRLADPDLSLEEVIDKCSGGSVSADMVKQLTIEDEKGLQTCFDKLQIVINNQDFKLTEPDDGPDWSHKDTTWYGLYYDDEHKLKTKKIYFIGDLERRFYTNDQNADDIVMWLEKYVPNDIDLHNSYDP